MEKPKPTVADMPYGPYPRNELDLYLAKTDGRAPLWVWIHGGGFMHGDKSEIPAKLINDALAAGVSVASINYRLSQQAPWPACVMDAARAVQFLRWDAGSWKLDPKRVACGGGSAGGGISLWLAFHEDLAKSDSDDPVADMSTRPNLVTGVSTQSSYDINFIKEIIPGPGGDCGPLRLLFQVKPKDRQTARAKKLFADGSPYHFATADAPPIFLFYPADNIQPTDQLPEGHGIHHPRFGEVLKEKLDLPEGHGIHHPRFGEVLKEKLDSLGVECVVSYKEDHPGLPSEKLGDAFVDEALGFLKRHFGIAE